MEFEFVLRKLLEEFRKEKIRYALIGGFAMGVLGLPRATFDLDFLILRDDLEKLDRVLKNLGYTLQFRTENVSQYRSDDPRMGSLDFLHAFRKISVNMLARAMEKKLPRGKHSLYILQPEDIIGLKIQAMANDVDRKTKEMADIEALMRVYGRKLDWERLEEYFRLFEMDEEFKNLKGRFGNAN